MVVLGDNGSWKNYWLATRKASVTWEHDECSYATFGPGHVHSGYVDSRGSLFDSNGYETSALYGLRPVVPLKSELPNKTNT